MKSKAQYRFFRRIQGTDHPAAEIADAELAVTSSLLGLPEKVHKPRKRPYVPRPTRRKMENKEIAHSA